jgi:four helix bundle protein
MKNKAPRHYRNLDAWQAAMEATIACYELARRLPALERFELAAQMRRAAVSMPSNIAEGHSYGTDPMLCKHLRTALGSVGELETQVELAQQLSYFSEADVLPALERLAKAARLIHGLLRSVSPRIHTRVIVWLVCCGVLGWGS